MSSTIRIHYPVRQGRIVLRGEPDWRQNIEAVRVDAQRGCHEFLLTAPCPYRYFKPVLLDGSERWAVGANYLRIDGDACRRDYYPYFTADAGCSECELRELADASGRRHRFRVFYPPGYHENELQRYPVLYMQDGQNLFFPDEAFGGQHWRVAETLKILDAMNAIEQIIVVGIYPSDRTDDYTAPGYGRYGQFVVNTLKPFIDDNYRTLNGPAHTAVMGSSLGGVVSLHLAWQYPEHFGAAACLSSTFGWRDDLAQRIAADTRRAIRVYLDSGWPGDNYEATRHMRTLLAMRGFHDGGDLHYFSFPDAMHNEHAWAMRAHLPIQILFSPERSTCKNTSLS